LCPMITLKSPLSISDMRSWPSPSAFTSPSSSQMAPTTCLNSDVPEQIRTLIAVVWLRTSPCLPRAPEPGGVCYLTLHLLTDNVASTAKASTPAAAFQLRLDRQ
jgi:hypothetical protein